MTRIASRAIRQAILPVALLGLFACGCACFGHHGVQAATPGGGHSPQHVATRGTIPPEFLDLVTTKKAFANLSWRAPEVRTHSSVTGLGLSVPGRPASATDSFHSWRRSSARGTIGLQLPLNLPCRRR